MQNQSIQKESLRPSAHYLATRGAVQQSEPHTWTLVGATNITAPHTWTLLTATKVTEPHTWTLVTATSLLNLTCEQWWLLPTSLPASTCLHYLLRFGTQSPARMYVWRNHIFWRVLQPEDTFEISVTIFQSTPPDILEDINVQLKRTFVRELFLPPPPFNHRLTNDFRKEHHKVALQKVQLRNSPHFIKREGALLRSQEPALCQYPEPWQTSRVQCVPSGVLTSKLTIFRLYRNINTN